MNISYSELETHIITFFDDIAKMPEMALNYNLQAYKAQILEDLQKNEADKLVKDIFYYVFRLCMNLPKPSTITTAVFYAFQALTLSTPKKSAFEEKTQQFVKMIYDIFQPQSSLYLAEIYHKASKNDSAISDFFTLFHFLSHPSYDMEYFKFLLLYCATEKEGSLQIETIYYDEMNADLYVQLHAASAQQLDKTLFQSLRHPFFSIAKEDFPQTLSLKSGDTLLKIKQPQKLSLSEDNFKKKDLFRKTILECLTHALARNKLPLNELIFSAEFFYGRDTIHGSGSGIIEPPPLTLIPLVHAIVQNFSLKQIAIPCTEAWKVEPNAFAVLAKSICERNQNIHDECLAREDFSVEEEETINLNHDLIVFDQQNPPLSPAKIPAKRTVETTKDIIFTIFNHWRSHHENEIHSCIIKDKEPAVPTSPGKVKRR